MSDTITFTGNVGGVPETRTGPNGSSFVTFRVASSQGYYDRNDGSWVDQGTHWYSVVAKYELGANVLRSLKSGDAVIVTGRLKLKPWEREGRSGFSLDVSADAVGINLAFGTAEFTRVKRGDSGAGTAQPEVWARPLRAVDDLAPGDEADREPEQVGASAGADTPF